VVVGQANVLGQWREDLLDNGVQVHRGLLVGGSSAGDLRKVLAGPLTTRSYLAETATLGPQRAQLQAVG